MQRDDSPSRYPPSGIFLTAEEIVDLTGLIQFRAQQRWLQEHGFVFHVRADGRPVVSRRHTEQQIGVEIERQRVEVEPNWEAI